MAEDFKYMPVRLVDEVDMKNNRDWLSRLLEMIPVRGTLDYRCFLGAPWRIDFPASELGEISYHVILGGTAVLEDPEGNPDRRRYSAVSARIGACPPRRERCGASPSPPAIHA